MAYVQGLQTSLRTKYESEFRTGIHISDLTLCMRKSILRKLFPTPLTVKELNFFTSGRAIHEAIQTLASSDKKFEIEKEVVREGIIAHVDLFDTETNTAIECKSMRVSKADAPKKHHLDQLKAYMAMTDATNGTILYQLLMNFDDKPFVEFDITTTPEENKETLQVLIVKAKDYAKNLEAKTPYQAMSVFNDKDMNWLCKDCPYFVNCCKEGNNETK